LDTLACNYDPDANFNVSQLCCYGPGNCNGLDISLVCPTVGLDEQALDGFSLQAYPNPFHDELFLKVTAGVGGSASYVLSDALGREVRSGVRFIPGGNYETRFVFGELARGVYHLRMELDREVRSLVLVKD
jgi:hypothetical protein